MKGKKPDYTQTSVANLSHRTLRQIEKGPPQQKAKVHKQSIWFVKPSHGSAMNHDELELAKQQAAKYLPKPE